MSHLTPIGSRLLTSLNDEYLRMQNEWFSDGTLSAVHQAWKLRVSSGSRFFMGGIKFSGSARLVYWDTIQRYLRKKIGSVFDESEQELKQYSLEIRAEALTEAKWIVSEFAAKIRRAAIEKDRILRGNGIEFPLEQDMGRWEGTCD
jgi:hypothetical protein